LVGRPVTGPATTADPTTEALPSAVAPIPPEDRRDIQGLVTTGFGHLSHAGFLFLRITEPAAARRWLGEVLDHVSSAAPWPTDAAGAKRRPRQTLNVATSFPGLEALGLPDETLTSFPIEFTVGMASRTAILGDSGPSAPCSWELGGPANPPLHLLLIVHGASEHHVGTRLDQLVSGASGVESVALERGARVARSREQFGFAADGLSEPEIAGLRRPRPDQAVVPAGEFLLGHRNAFGVYPVSLIVDAGRDPGATLPPLPEGALPAYRDFGRNGTFLVYRKLAQDVAGFWSYVSDACRPSADGGDAPSEPAMRRLAAKLMGRWPSGAPLVMTPDEDDPALGTRNDFLYLPTDAAGLACPVGAHIRRANPRDSLQRLHDPGSESLRSVAQHRILRRGIRYGDSLLPPEAIEKGRVPVGLTDDGHDRGLHFLAVNADTQRQFEFIQQSWLNNPAFNGLFDNKDPLLGDNDGTGHMNIPAAPVRQRIGGVPRFVTVRGGGYWFMPGLRALRFLTRSSGSSG
jgi:deferrochelatase/peroxidase EfeB